MNRIMNFFLVFISFAFLFSCATTEREKVIKKAYKESFNAHKVAKKTSAKRPDFNTMLFSNSEKIDYSKFSVESSRVFPKNDCEVVNVNVYYKDKYGTKFLVTNDNIIVNNCSQKNTVDSCSGILPDGNFVTETMNLNDVCLYSILSKDKYINHLYAISLKKLLASN